MEPTASPSRPSSNRWAEAAALAVAFLAATSATRAQEQQPPPGGARIVIGGTVQRFAIPECVPLRGDDASRAACRTLAEVLRDDLRFEGLFQFVPDNLLSALPPQNPVAPNFEDWRSIGAGVLIITRAGIEGEDQLAVEVRAYFVESGQTMLAKRYTGPADNPRVFAHQASDEIVALAQHQGIARTKIVFTSDRDSTPERRVKELYIADYDGHNPRRVTVNRSLNILPQWSADGRSLAYVSYRNETPTIFLAHIFEGRSAANVTGEAAGYQSFSPAVSPDGRQIAFASNRTGNMEIWVVNSDGTGLKRLTSSIASDTAPAWSPTGRELAFTSDRGGTPQIYLMDNEGLNVRRLTTIGNWNDSPEWNPKFSEIAYTSRIEGGWEVAVIDLASRQVRQVTLGRGKCEYASWAPNGRHLMFSCDRGGRRQIAVTDREGRSFRVLPVGPGSNEQPDWGP